MHAWGLPPLWSVNPMHLHRPPLGLRPGPVAHAVMHDAALPVAVVPHP